MKFQYAILAFFGVMAVIAVVVFSIAPDKGKNDATPGAAGTVVIWGTFPTIPGFAQVIERFNKSYENHFSISYEFHDPKNFDTDIVEALAGGRGPDILLLPDDLVLRHSDKIQLISYGSIPPDVFQSTYVQAAEIYLRDKGLLALPFAIDPLVLYWNRDLFNSASLTQPPRYWDELLTMSPPLTKRDPKTSQIAQSAIAFGEFANVEHAKDILAMLFLQVGSPLVALENGKPVPKLLFQQGTKFVPSEDVISALRFFMDFSNPEKQTYTWSRARQGSLDEFINGNLALYLGYASENNRIKEKNPHLNFAVAQVPVTRGTKAQITFAKIYGLAVLKSSRNQPTAFIAVTRLLNDVTPEKDFAAAFNLPPVLRVALSERPIDAALATFYDAAIRGRTWLDPKPEVSDKAFQVMVESVSSGRNEVSDAIGHLSRDLLSALAPYDPDQH